MTAQRITVTQSGDISGDIQLYDLSNKFRWRVSCDYGCLAMTPENGGEYVYKKYKAGDRIGDFTVYDIQTFFHNTDYFDGYLAGAWASFEGEAVLTGEIREYSDWGELYFYPDEESRKKLPVVNFVPKLNEYFDEYYSYDNLIIWLGSRADHPEIDFNGIPKDGTRVKVKLKINKYSYYAEYGIPFRGLVNIVDGSFEVL